jgi:hypothetical protein
VQALAGPDLPRWPDVVLVGPLQVDVAGDQQAVVAADGGVDADPAALDPGLDLAVVEADGGVELKLQPAPDPLDHPQQLAVGLPGAALAHGEAVQQPASPLGPRKVVSSTRPSSR